MANRRTNEREELDELDEEFLSDDEELDDEEEDEEEFDYNSLSPSEKKRYDKMRSDIESRIVDQIAKGDQKSQIFKGLQRVINGKDRDITQLKTILQSFSDRLGNAETNGSDVEFLRDIVEEMLDDEGKKVFRQRLETHKAKKENQDTKNRLNQLMNGTTPSAYGAPNYGQEDETIKQYRREATSKLRSLAKRAGVDPDDDGLDFGDEEEPLLDRMRKLEDSIDKVKDRRDDEDISRVRRKVNPPKSGVDAPIKKKTRDDYEYGDPLARGAASIIQAFNDGKLKPKRK